MKLVRPAALRHISQFPFPLSEGDTPVFFVCCFRGEVLVDSEAAVVVVEREATVEGGATVVEI